MKTPRKLKIILQLIGELLKRWRTNMYTYVVHLSFEETLNIKYMEFLYKLDVYRCIFACYDIWTLLIIFVFVLMFIEFYFARNNMQQPWITSKVKDGNNW